MRMSAAVATLAALLAAGTGPIPAMAQIVTASPTYAAAPGKLTEAETKAMFSGKYREDGVDAAGNAWSVDATASGALTVTAGTYTDSGRARVDGNKLCVAWNKAWKGAEHCFRYAHHGSELASYGADGTLDSVVTISR